MPVVGETIRIDHGDKVVERYIVHVSHNNVRSRARWISGENWVYAKELPNFEWDCTHAAWEEHVAALKEQGKLLKHEIPEREVIAFVDIKPAPKDLFFEQVMGRIKRPGEVICPGCDMKGTPFPYEDPIVCGNCGHEFKWPPIILTAGRAAGKSTTQAQHLFQNEPKEPKDG
jgi:hypothetical protein